MSSPSRLLTRPAPPHDPYSLLLAGWIGPDAWNGFRIAAVRDVDVAMPANVVTLGPTADAMRLLTEPSGSFGGVRPPGNVAIAPGGDIYLLDPAKGTIARFNPCCCRFDAVPCATRAEGPPGIDCELPRRRPARVPLDRLRDAQAIAVCDGALLVADAGHARIVEYSLNGFVPRRAITLPAAQRATLATPWYPSALALDGAGNLFVADPHNGRVDRFDARRQWLAPPVTGLAGVDALAADCADRVYAVLQGSTGFGPIAIASQVIASLDATAPLFDWQSLVLTGVPAAARLDIEVVASETALTAADIAALPATAWRHIAAAAAGSVGGVRVAITGAIGRYLYVRVSPRAASASAVLFVASGARVVRIVDGTATPLDPRADRAGPFPRPGLVVDAGGTLHLACGGSLARFDGAGARAGGGESGSPSRYQRSGTLVTDALDAQIEGCQWHRVELCGAIPAGCSIEVRTTTSDLALSGDEVAALGDDAWCTRRLAAGAVSGKWDCLVQSPPGRYLWLALTLRGDGHATPCIESIALEFPRISLRRYLPAVFGSDPASADFTDRFTAVFDATLRSIERTLDRQATLFDPLSAPSRRPKGAQVDFLSWLASWVGVALAQEWPEARRRRYFKTATRLYCLRGTHVGLRRQLLLLLGFDQAYDACLDERPRARCVAKPRNCGPQPPRTRADPPPLVLEHYRLRRWLHAGSARLGDDAILWGKRIVNRSELSGKHPPPDQTGNARVGETQLKGVPDPLHDPFLVYAHRFSVFVPARVRSCDGERRAFERLLARETPAHTACDIRYVEPRFRVGVQAMIGLDSVVARTPRGVTLAQASLGQGTVLSAPPSRRDGAQLAVGNARIGSTTLLVA